MPDCYEATKEEIAERKREGEKILKKLCEKS